MFGLGLSLVVDAEVLGPGLAAQLTALAIAPCGLVLTSVFLNR